MSKHTEGPWVFRKKDGNLELMMGNVCAMSSENYYPWVPENPADWELMAAAPDLLEALQRIKQRLDTCHLHIMNGHEVFESVYVKMIDKAIAKATGEE